MNTLRLRLTAVAVAALSTLTGLAPAQAFQMPSAPKIAAESPVTNVQWRSGWRGDHRGDRRGWYNGHRGYRYQRPGYRYHNGLWFPLAAFGAGALIGGALAAPRAAPRAAYSGNHVAWCESRYRTYRASDDTYVPRAGVRARCVSPY